MFTSAGFRLAATNLGEKLMRHYRRAFSQIHWCPRQMIYYNIMDTDVLCLV